MKYKVIGLGLGRTGTSTLGTACEKLGYKLMENNFSLTKEIRGGKYDSALSIANKYDCLEDFPWPLIYEQLYEKFPDAKYILTKRRNANVWVTSYIYQSIRGRKKVRKKLPHVYMYEYGYPYPVGYEKEWKDIYIKHNKDVRDFFKEKDNYIELCWENGDGWKELCNFIREEIPNIDFPHRKQAFPYPYFDELYKVAKKDSKKYFDIK